MCHSKRSKKKTTINWLQPLVGSVKWNFDRCSLSNPRQLGIEGVIIDHSGIRVRAYLNLQVQGLLLRQRLSIRDLDAGQRLVAIS